MTVAQPNAGTATALFTISLSVVSGSTVTVAYATADGTATVAGHDYAAAAGTLSFAPGMPTFGERLLANLDQPGRT